MERIDKILAKSGYGSRKEIKKIIKEGRVSIGQEIITDPGFKLDLENQKDILLDGKATTLYETLIFMLSKPAGLITAMSDDYRETIADCIPLK